MLLTSLALQDTPMENYVLKVPFDLTSVSTCTMQCDLSRERSFFQEFFWQVCHDYILLKLANQTGHPGADRGDERKGQS